MSGRDLGSKLPSRPSEPMPISDTRSIRRVHDSRGAVMAEYGLLIAIVAISMLTALGLFHDELISFYVNATSTAANQVNEGAQSLAS